MDPTYLNFSLNADTRLVFWTSALLTIKWSDHFCGGNSFRWPGWIKCCVFQRPAQSLFAVLHNLVESNCTLRPSSSEGHLKHPPAVVLNCHSISFPFWLLPELLVLTRCRKKFLFLGRNKQCLPFPQRSKGQTEAWIHQNWLCSHLAFMRLPDKAMGFSDRSMHGLKVTTLESWYPTWKTGPLPRYVDRTLPHPPVLPSL